MELRRRAVALNKNATAITIAIIVCLCVTSTTARFPSKFPCHLDRPGMNKGVTCTHMQLPPGLCGACPLRAPDAQGNFKLCDDTYDTGAPGCIGKMEEYVAANPCDPIRKKAVSDYKANPANNAARSVIDYFLYAVCEQCCDCIPIGTTTKYNPSKVLYDVNRGNCPAHAWFDICKLSLEVKKITLIGGTPPAATDLKACDLLAAWFESPESRNWVANAKTSLVPPLAGFLEGLVDAAQCRQEDLWLKCFDLEFKQNRLGTPASPLPVPAAPPSLPAAAPPSLPATEPPSLPAAAPSPKPDVSVASDSIVKASVVPAFSSDPARGEEPINLGSESPTPSAAPSVNTEAELTGDGRIETPISGDRAPEPGTNLTDSNLPEPTELAAPPIAPLGELPFETTEAGNATCFPSDARVELSTGQVITLAQLQIGDYVRVNANTPARYQPVFMFSHRDPAAVTEHIIVNMNNNKRLTLSPGHYVAGRRADMLQPGDQLETVDGTATVTGIAYTRKRGLYNPHTSQGFIVVDGVLCSTYTDTIKKSLAHAALSPVRSAFRCGLVSEKILGGFLRFGSPIPL